MTKRQKLFVDMTLGVLIFSVILGFFNDYTDILHSGTYSVTFGVAIVMQLLTYLTFWCKDTVIARFKHSHEQPNKVAMGVSVWLVMFFSKFVFLWVIDTVFRDAVQISSFVGLFSIILIMTIATSLMTFVYKKLD